MSSFEVIARLRHCAENKIPIDEELLTATLKVIAAANYHRRKAREDLACSIIVELECAIQSNLSAIDERIEKGHRDKCFESMCEGKILAMQGIRDFITEEVNTK